jgi:integrase
MRVSFYLRTPSAKTSKVCVSLSKGSLRKRFALDIEFLTSECNYRFLKKNLNLVKKKSPYYSLYSKALNDVEALLLKIEGEYEEYPFTYSLNDIVRTFWSKNKKPEKPIEEEIHWETLFDKFCSENQIHWSDGRQKHFQIIKKNIQSFEKSFYKMDLQNIDKFLNDIRSLYYSDELNLNNSTINKKLKNIKQFFNYIIENKLIVNESNRLNLKPLKTIEAFKIRLTSEEVQHLMELDLSESPEKEIIKDLFLCEIFTGQRFGDVNSVINRNNLIDDTLTFIQQKTKIKVNIPLYDELKNLIEKMLNKYPNGIKICSNQHFNRQLKEICKGILLDITHRWQTIHGSDIIYHEKSRWELACSHLGRRSFCNLALRKKINLKSIMRVTGHTNIKQFYEYVNAHDEDLMEDFKCGIF